MAQFYSIKDIGKWKKHRYNDSVKKSICMNFQQLHELLILYNPLWI